MPDFYNNDELKIYRGEDFIVSDYIHIHQPTLGEICDYGEEDYYSMIYQLCATPQNMKWQLWDAGVDYTEITPYQLFYSILYKIYPKERTSIIFGDLDFTKFEIVQRKDDGSVELWQRVKKDDNIPTFIRRLFNKDKKIFKSDSGYEDIVIDEFTYNLITDYLRKVHDIEKDERIPANNITKRILIEDAKEEYEINKNKEYHSQLRNLVSAMVNSGGFKYNHTDVWDMKINAFMDSVKRISKIKNSNLLLQSGYSGFGINLKDVNKKDLDWLGELS